jgi:hypothetical protein
MSDLVERLRAVEYAWPPHFSIMREAAARVEALEALLREIDTEDEHGYAIAPMNYNLRLKIRAALAPEQDK